MSAKTHDNLYLAAGGIVLLGTCIGAFFQQSDITAFRESIIAPSSGSAYEATPLTLTTTESKQWSDTKSQSAGADWKFDVFTPPVIYYNIQTKKFTVTVPHYEIIPETGTGPVTPLPPDTFGLELVKVEQPLFRLQLVGYIGEGPTARGNFENQLTHEVVFGTTGKKLPALNLEIVKFSAERRRTKVEGGTEIVETVATAVVRDTITGVETPLDAKVRTPEGPLMVTLKKVDGTLVSAKSGETLTIGEAAFKIGELQLTPPSAVVTKSGAALTEPKTETLVIPPPPAPVVAAPVEGVDGAAPASPFPPAGTKSTPGGFPGN